MKRILILLVLTEVLFAFSLSCSMVEHQVNSNEVHKYRKTISSRSYFIPHADDLKFRTIYILKGFEGGTLEFYLTDLKESVELVFYFDPSNKYLKGFSGNERIHYDSRNLQSLYKAKKDLREILLERVYRERKNVD